MFAKIVKIIDSATASTYGFSQQQVNDTVGKIVNISGYVDTAYVIGKVVECEIHLPLYSRYYQPLCMVQLEMV